MSFFAPTLSFEAAGLAGAGAANTENGFRATKTAGADEANAMNLRLVESALPVFMTILEW
jgi:hypothetical protein